MSISKSLRNISALSFKTHHAIEVCKERLTDTYHLKMFNSGTDFYYWRRNWGLYIKEAKDGTIKIHTIGGGGTNYVYRVSLSELEDGTVISCRYYPLRDSMLLFVLAPGIFAIPWPFFPDVVWQVGLGVFLILSLPLLFIMLFKIGTAESCIADYIFKALDAVPISEKEMAL